MLISWFVGDTDSTESSCSSSVYPMVFPMKKDEINAMLDWIRNHRCLYSQENSARDILEGYTNNEIINNGLLGMLLEQYGNDGSREEGHLSIVMQPSVCGIKYMLKCKCGMEFQHAKPREENFKK